MNPQKGASLLLVTVSLLAACLVPSAHAWVFPPYQEIIPFSSSIVQGDPLIVQGTEPNFTSLRIWFIGPDSLSVTDKILNPQEPFVYSLDGGRTRNLTPGEYHLLIQFPGMDGAFGVNESYGQNLSGTTGFTVAYASLVSALNDPSANDTYADYVVWVTPAPGPANAPAPALTISPIADHFVGDTVVIQGTAELPTGAPVVVTVGFPRPLGSGVLHEGGTGLLNVTATVNGGVQVNTWSVPLSTTNLAPGVYPVAVSSPATNALALSSLNLTNGVISMNPVTMDTENNTISITGSTTLPAGDMLNVSIRHEPLAGTRCVPPGMFCGDYEGAADITGNGSGMNAWALTANTTFFWSGNYTVIVSSGGGSAVPQYTAFTSPPVIIPGSEESRRSFLNNFRVRFFA